MVNYRGVLGSRLFATAQVSRKEFGFRNSGGTSTAITDSPFLTRGSAPGIVFSHYNAPYFDSTDPEDRNNNQVAASLSYFLTTGRLGSHDIKGGFENYVSSRTGGNSQTATDFVFQADYLTAGGEPVLNGQQLIPTFVPGVTRAQNWLSTRGATIDIRTTSLYLHDKWTANENWTFDLGMRLRERRQRSDRRPDDGRYLDHRPEARGRVRSYRDRTARLPEHVCPLRRQVQRGTVCGEHERR